MARARLRIGERGDITSHKIEDRKWKSRCYYRDSRGKRRQLTAQAATKAASVNALKDRWHEVSSKIITRHDGDQNLTVDQLAQKYFDQQFKIRAKNKINTETLPAKCAQYENHLKPRIGGALVVECTAGMLDEAVVSIIQPDGKLVSVADKCRSILVAIFDYAVSHNIVANNPAEGISSVEYKAPRPKVWSDAAIYNIRRALKYWEQRPPKKTVPIADVFDLTLATACRVSEVLGFNWENMYLPEEDDKPGWVHVHQAVVRRTGVANYVGDPKTKKEKRLSLPVYAVKILKQRKNNGTGRGLVFVNRKGRPYSRDHMYRAAERAFEVGRQELGIELPDSLPFHNSRRTSLTEIAEVHGLEAASRQGGHSSLRVTERHYVLRDEFKVIDFSSTLERFGKTED